MNKISSLLLVAALGTLALSSCTTHGPVTKAIASQSSASAIRSESQSALRQLYAEDDTARNMSTTAKGILVFPNITKAGLGIGGQIGQGALFLPNGTTGYYQTTAASYGLQAGAQKYGYALFLMDDNALQHLYGTAGWEVGSAPSLVVVDKGISRSLSTNTIQNGTYAYLFNERGLMAGSGLQGSKITRIEPKR